MSTDKELRLLLIDNHDSFVYNIVGLLEHAAHEDSVTPFSWDVRMNDEVTAREASLYDALILSPGPGLPEEAGNLMEIIAANVNKKPILGICLGFQAIAQHFGARLIHMPLTRHGHLSHLLRIDASDPLLGALHGSSPAIGRYHSWGIDHDSLPATLAATSFDEEGNLMSLRHSHLPIFGTQFHPESIISDCGAHIIRSFLRIASL